MTAPAAFVKPRVHALGQAGTLRLENALDVYAGAAKGDVVALVGKPGFGKSTALAYLQRVLPERPRFAFLDEPERSDVLRASRKNPVVYAASHPHELAHSAIVHLAPWGEDEWIEYLLTTHRAASSSVLRRVQNDPFRTDLRGIPQLWQPVLDELAADEALPGVQTALRRILARLMTSERIERRAALLCIEALLNEHPADLERLLLWQTIATPLQNLIRHRPLQLLLATDWIANELAQGRRRDTLHSRFPRDLIDLVGVAAAETGAVRIALLNSLDSNATRTHATAASILHASGTGWELPCGRAFVLDGAYLAGACLAGTNLKGLSAVACDLRRANLDGADLEQANMAGAQLAGASLRGASLRAAVFDSADLAGADLSEVRAPAAQLSQTCLRDAMLERAVLRGTEFHACDLRGARLVRADLAGATLDGVDLDDADLSAASLKASRLSNLRLRTATLAGAIWGGASLWRCSLEGVELRAADFRQARFEEVDFTDAIMPSADFRGAAFHGVGLAGVEWENVSLRCADLRGVTFHAGSSRSGLVGSPLASEGTRTGFYTDEADEQHFKSPEEIRKANLCRADLREANLDGVDFYLVDVRGAKFDRAQERWLRRCGAILDAE